MAEYEHTTARGQANVKNGVLIPAAQALTTGALAAATVTSWGLLLHWDHLPALAATVGTSASLLAWGYFRADWVYRVNHILGIRETAAQQQAQATAANVIKLNLYGDQGQPGHFLTFGIDRARLVKFSQGIAAGKPFTVRTWAGGAGLFTDSEFAQLRDELLSRGLARWRGKDPRNGCELSPAAMAVFRYLAAQPPTPPAPGLWVERVKH